MNYKSKYKSLKVLCILIIFSFIMANITGCANKSEDKVNGSNSVKDGKINIVTTIFPEYDWVKEIVKGNDNAKVSFLLDKGVDLHSFQPSAEDILKIGEADIFIYVGGESDDWVKDALKEVKNKDIKVINLLEELGDLVKEEEEVEGMEGHDQDHDDADDHDDEDDHDDADDNDDADDVNDTDDHDDAETELDEHVWLSLKNAKEICEEITEEIVSIDPDNKKLYEENYENYRNKLTELDEKYENAVKEANTDTLLFGDRFPFRYLVDDYKLKYYAAFSGCSAESEASFETITFLADKVDKLKLNSILQIESADGKIAETIKKNTTDKNQEILTLDSLQSTTADEEKKGKTYLSVMEDNLKVLKKALGVKTK